MKTRLPLAFLAMLAVATAADPPAQLPTVSHATRPKPTFTMEDFKAQTQQNKDGAFLLEIPMILTTAADPEVQGLLAGQAVETTAQIMPETTDNADGRRLRIFRSQLLCCAAHARQCSVAIEFAGKAPAFKEQAWVTLIGTLAYRREERKIVPVIIVREIKEVPAPANPLLQ